MEALLRWEISGVEDERSWAPADAHCGTKPLANDVQERRLPIGRVRRSRCQHLEAARAQVGLDVDPVFGPGIDGDQLVFQLVLQPQQC